MLVLSVNLHDRARDHNGPLAKHKCDLVLTWQWTTLVVRS